MNKKLISLVIIVLLISLSGCAFYEEHGESHRKGPNIDIGDYMAQEQYEEMAVDPGNTDIMDEGPIASEMDMLPVEPYIGDILEP
ncbi:hypothetical protein ACFLQ8_00465 [Candidatus Auribacterota bacterium]